MNEYQLPGQILFNYEELKQELTEKVSMYETLVYTDDEIKQAKADKANLNKLKKALNDERIRREKEYMQPFNDFKSKINEIISIIDKPVAVIDKQVKEFEEKKKSEKKKEIIAFYESHEKAPDWLDLDKISDPKWLNASVSLKSVFDDINAKVDDINKNIDTLSKMPEFGFEATEVYKSTLDINKALNEAQRMSEMAKKKAEREAEQARMKADQEAAMEMMIKEEEAKKAEFSNTINPPVVPETIQNSEPNTDNIEPVKEWVSFRCLLSVEDAQALGAFFKDRSIQFEQI